MRRYDRQLVTAQLVLAAILVVLCLPVPFLWVGGFHGPIESTVVFPVLAAEYLLAWLLTRRHPVSDTQRSSIVFGLALGALLVANHLWSDPIGLVSAIILWFFTFLVVATTVVTGIQNAFARRQRADWEREKREANPNAPYGDGTN
jgi:O-antigen/teichoic acid export membrane protein